MLYIPNAEEGIMKWNCVKLPFCRWQGEKLPFHKKHSKEDGHCKPQLGERRYKVLTEPTETVGSGCERLPLS